MQYFCKEIRLIFVAKYAPSERRRDSAFFYFTFHSQLLQLSELKTGFINQEYKNISEVFRWQHFFLSTWNPPGSKKNLGQMEKWLREFTGTELAGTEGKHFLVLVCDAAEVNWEQQEVTL